MPRVSTQLPFPVCRELNRWCTAGYAAVSVCAAVQHGCLEGLETRQAFGLASASLVLTDGVPTALSQLVVPTLRHASLYDDTVGLAGQTCNAIVTMLRMISRQLSSPSGSNQPAAVVGAQPQVVAARLLRSTAARPALILTALENLTDTLLYTKPHAQDSDERYTGESGKRLFGTLVDAAMTETVRLRVCVRVPTARRRGQHAVAGADFTHLTWYLASSWAPFPSAVRNWLDLAALVLTDTLCAEEAQRLRQQPNLHARISTLASGERVWHSPFSKRRRTACSGTVAWAAALHCQPHPCRSVSQASPNVATQCTAGTAYRLLLPEAWDSSPDGVSSWQAALLDATTIITGGVLLPTATGGLTELVLGAESHGNSQLRGLVPTALSSLDTALEDTAADGSSATTSAVRALQLAAFVADAMLAVGCDAGLAPAPGTIGATRAALQAPRQDTGEAEREQLQLRLLLQSHAQVPALLAAVDAALQRGVLNVAGGAYSEARCPLASLRIGCFVSWLGIAGIQAPGSLLSLQPGAVASCAAAAWLPVLRHSLQLHAAYSGSEAADGFASNLGPFMERLAQGSRGLAAKHFRAALLMPRGRGEQSQERLAAGASAGAEVAAQGPDAALQPGAELPAFHQLATATCILAQLAASSREVQGERSWRQLLCWGNGELREAGVVKQLESVSQGFYRLLNASKPLPTSGDGSSSSAGVLAADGCAVACSLRPLAAGAVLCCAVCFWPSAAAQSTSCACLDGVRRTHLQPICITHAPLSLLSCRQLGASLLQIIAAGSTLLDALAPRQPGVAFASAAGRSRGPLVDQAVKSLATIAQRMMILAHDVGQAAAAAEAERLVGCALKLAAVGGWCGVPARVRREQRLQKHALCMASLLDACHDPRAIGPWPCRTGDVMRNCWAMLGWA